MADKKRKPRKKFIKRVDILQPIDLNIIGTKDDPCFGKLYDPQASECQRCGDSEICAIAMGQANHLKRAEVEATNDFKDLEEEKIVQTGDKKVIAKQVRNRIREMVKMGASKGVHFEMAVDDIYASFFKDGYKKSRVRRVINKMLDNSTHLKLHKKTNTLLWNSPQ